MPTLADLRARYSRATRDAARAAAASFAAPPREGAPRKSRHTGRILLNDYQQVYYYARAEAPAGPGTVMYREIVACGHTGMENPTEVETWSIWRHEGTCSPGAPHLNLRSGKWTLDHDIVRFLSEAAQYCESEIGEIIRLSRGEFTQICRMQLQK